MITSLSAMVGTSPVRGDRTSPRGRSAVVSALALSGIMATAALAVGFWLGSRHGAAGVAATTVAWGLCFTASLVALLVSVGFSHTPHALAANLGTMLIRMGVPLVGLMVLPKVLPGLVAAGLGTAILLLYLVGLAAETILAVRHVVPTSSATGRGTSRGAPSSNTEEA